MTKFLWNVRVSRVTHQYLEEIVEAETKEEAEALLALDEYRGMNHVLWPVDDRPDVFINSEYTERMDVLFPELYPNPEEEAEDE